MNGKTINKLLLIFTLGLCANSIAADTGSAGSEDIFVAFSTANAKASRGEMDALIRSRPNDSMDPLLRAAVNATEEAIINALIAGRDTVGDRGHTVKGIDHQKLRRLLQRHNSGVIQ